MGVLFIVRLTSGERIETYEQRLKKLLKSLTLNFSISQTIIKYLLDLSIKKILSF